MQNCTEPRKLQRKTNGFGEDVQGKTVLSGCVGLMQKEKRGIDLISLNPLTFNP